MTTTSLGRFIFTVKSSGCPLDQIENLLRGGYVAQPRQLEFHAAARECDLPGGPVRVGYGGARGTAKSHAALAQAVMDDAWRVPDLKVLFLRNVQKAAKESFEDLISKVLKGFPAEYVPSRSRLYLPNGSFVVLGGFVTESDINKYIGIEYDLMVLEDATLITKSRVDRLFGSLRTSKPGWRPRVYLTFNPGGVGHAWAKREYVDPYRAKQQTSTRYIHTGIEDNKFINLEYRQYLDGLTGWLRRAWRDGDWDISAGQFFTTYRDDIHNLKKPPFDKIPANWRVWLSLDYGFTHPTVAYLHTANEGVVYTVGEHWRQRWQVKQHADAIKEMLAKWSVTPGRVRAFPAGHDCWARKDDESPTIADKYKKQGFKLQPAKVDRVSGWAEMLTRLGDPDEGIEPTWYFYGCPRLAECLPVLQHDPHNPEDVLKWDIDETSEGGDDPGDAARYGLMDAPQRRLTSIAQKKAKGWNPQ